MHKSVIKLVAVTALLTACAKVAVVDKGAVFGDNYAEATFEFGVKNYSSFGSEIMQEYKIGSVKDLKKSERVAIFSKFGKGPKIFLLKANVRVFVFVEIKRIYGAPGITASGSNSCINGSSFIPEPNMKYRIIQTGNVFSSCDLKITEVESGVSPSSIEKILFPPIEPTNGAEG